MPVLLYPIRLYFPWNLLRIENQIFDWLLNEIHVHFVYKNHKTCCYNFTNSVLGRNPETKILLITPEMNVEVDSCVRAFNNGQPELAGTGILPGDRRCPYFGFV